MALINCESVTIQPPINFPSITCMTCRFLAKWGWGPISSFAAILSGKIWKHVKNIVDSKGLSSFGGVRGRAPGELLRESYARRPLAGEHIDEQAGRMRRAHRRAEPCQWHGSIQKYTNLYCPAAMIREPFDGNQAEGDEEGEHPQILRR